MTQKWTYRYEIKPGRWVFAPTEEARSTGVRVKHAVAKNWKPPSFFYHLRKGGHVAALRSHTSNAYFYKADLDDFFGRVNRSRVTRCLKQWFSYEHAREMASESVVRRPDLPGYVLPYGFVQSPILASLALDQSRLGSCLRSLNGRDDVRISIYVDDIIVSGNDKCVLEGIAETLSRVAMASRLPLSEAKTEGPADCVTAFNVKLSHSCLSITDERLRKLAGAYQAADSLYRIAGIESYVSSINDKQKSALGQASV